jgi:hypothetical protein
MNDGMDGPSAKQLGETRQDAFGDDVPSRGAAGAMARGSSQLEHLSRNQRDEALHMAIQVIDRKQTLAFRQI